MNSLAALLSRINRVVFVLGIAFFASTLGAVIFVGASNKDGTVPATLFAASSTDTPTKAQIARRFGELPLSFEVNTGQTDSAVKFVSHGPGYDLFLTASEAVLSLRKPQSQASDKSKQPPVVEGSVLRLKMIGANAAARVAGEEELPGRVNYFIGNDREKWRRNVPTYRKVHYTDVYPGIDIVYYGNQRELEYDFVVAAGANPKLIRFSVEGAARLRLDQQGNLLIALKHGDVRLNKPFIYQLTDDGSRSEVKGSYIIKGNEVRFKVRGADSAKPLVIDPVLSYSTFVGGNGIDQAFGIAVDAQGSAYITGTTTSFMFPTTSGAFNTDVLNGAFVTKLDPTGSSLVYSTFISGIQAGTVVVSGSPVTTATAIAVDSSGNAHITGTTTASDFPVVNPLKTSGIFFKTTNAGSAWSNNNAAPSEALDCLAVAPTNPNVIYAGNFKGFYRSTDGGTTWTKTSTAILSEVSAINSLAVDPTNPLIVYAGAQGVFKSTDGGNNWNLSLPGSIFRAIVFDPATPSTIYAGSSAGLFRSTDNGNTWTGINTLGSPTDRDILSMAIDPTAPSTIYVGTRGHGLFKTSNGGSSWTAINNGITSGFGTNSRVVDDVVIDPANSATIYVNVVGTINKSTNGGNSWAPVNNINVGIGIDAMVATPSTLYVGTVGRGVIKTTDGGTSWTGVNNGLWTAQIRVLAVDPSNPATLYAGGSDIVLTTDAFVSKLNSTGSDLLFSTYLGGSGNEIGNGITVDGSGNIYVAGNTKSENFPIQNAFQAGPSPTESGGNGFVTKLDPAVPSYVFSTYLGGSAKDDVNSIAIDSATNVYVTGTTSSTDFPTVVNAVQTKLGDTSGDAFVTKFNSNGSSLSYSTYLGGKNNDTGFGIAVDVSGNAYITGITSSTDFPTANPIQPTNGGSSSDAFVTKLNSQGSALVYSTYLGGSDIDVARGIAVDATGNAYVTGRSSSQDFPVVAGAIRTRSEIYKSVDSGANLSNDNYGLTKSAIFQIAVHPTQSGTVYAGTPDGMFRSTNGGRTWFAINNGLNDSRRINAIVIDPLTPSTIYIATNIFGVYKSTDGGNSWNLRSNGMESDVMGLAIDPVTPATLYAAPRNGPIRKTTDGADNWAPTGSGGPVSPFAVAVDPHNHTTVYATDFLGSAPVFKSTNAGASWQTIGLNDTGSGLFVKVSPHTPNLVYATMSIGGLFKSVDGGNNWSLVLPNSGEIVFDPVNADTLYFISNPGRLLKSTNGGQSWTPIDKGLNVLNAFALAVDPLRPSTFYVSAASSGDDDAFVTKINPSGSALIYSTLIGGIPHLDDPFTINEEAFGIALDSAGNAYITGGSTSPNFPTTANAYQPANLGATDVFVSKLTMSHIISGHVLEGGAPLSGAEVVLNDGTSISSVITESDGSYEFSHLREGGSFTVSAAKPHFTFAPPSQNFSNLNSNQTLDFIATPTNAPFFTISGQVTENGAGLAGVTMTLSGSQSGLRTTDNNGNYSFEVAGGGNYSVTASLLSLSFNPPSQTFNNLSASQTANFVATRPTLVVTNANNHGTGSLREAITNANATPGTDTITFNIPGPGIKVINLLTSLPEITDPVVIDASTQPGYAGAPLIELNGDNLGFESGLVITAGNSTVRGLAIGNFKTSEIVLRSSNNVIQGNFIGTNAAGTNAFPSGSNGVEIPPSSNTNNLIGGTTAGAGNLISGNATGILIESPGNTVQGNLIGTDITGTKKVPNLFGIQADVPNTLIGGLTSSARNIISGNGSAGVLFGNIGSKLQGNFIGTDITGTQPLSNGGGGVISGTNALIGGDVPGARNVISGNEGFANLVLGGSPFGPGAIVQGNYIGTDVTGTRALSLSTSTGIVVVGSNNVIGGSIPGAQNVISGNVNGIQVGSFRSEPAQGNVIQGNLIGLNALGTGPLPNSQIGISFIDAFNNTVGGTQTGAANKIAFNGGTGVQSLSALSGTRMSVRGNSIFSNGQLGIDLDGDGVTANDPADADEGANNRQNFPVLTSVTSVGNNTTIQGTLNSTANKTFLIDFYSNAALDPSGHGEGAMYFGTTAVHTDGSGNATINANFPAPLLSGRVITATATDDVGNTSEFSAGDIASATGNVQFSVASMQVIEDLGVVNITVLRKGGTAGNLSIDYATVDGTATAGQDYSSTSGTLTFSSGETSKSFQIPITDDAVTEPDETFTVELRNPPSLEALGAPSNLVVTIQDRTTVPVIGHGFESVPEGDAGATSQALFTVNLSAATGRSVSVNYATSNGSATGGASCGNPGTDYETTSGTITFQPGTTAVTIPVRICGDRSAEANETISIDLSNPANATVSQTPAPVLIIDDDSLVLLLDESDINRPAALDAFLLVRDPFRVRLPDWFPTAGPDRNTRVMFFVRGLELNPGEPASAVVVRMGNGSEFFDVPAEDVRPVPGVDFTQVTVRLPDGMPAGLHFVTIKAHFRTTNVGAIEIAP